MRLSNAVYISTANSQGVVIPTCFISIVMYIHGELIGLLNHCDWLLLGVTVWCQ